MPPSGADHDAEPAARGGDDAVVDAVVLSAVISGLVSAAVRRDDGRSVPVVDVSDRVGGNHLVVDRGGFTFDVGGLVSQDDSPLLRHVPELIERYVPITPSWVKLTPQGVITDVRIGGRTVTARRLVSTVPLVHARRLRGLQVDEPLPTVRLISLFVSLAGGRGPPPSILDDLSHGGSRKRLTVYSDFYGTHDGRAFGVESFGRQDGFDHQPTARVSTRGAEAALAVPAPRV